MAIEEKRHCGYRKVGGLYLVADGIWYDCDRLPMEVGYCPVCGSGIHFVRSIAEIYPFDLWDNHLVLDMEIPRAGWHKCDCNPCIVCQPPRELAYIMTVGNRYYTPESFIEEAQELGISKRIPWKPKKLELGKTVVYLAHPKGAMKKVLYPAGSTIKTKSGEQAVMTDIYQDEPTLGIIAAFIPQRVEKLIWKSEATPEAVEKLEKRGITPVVVPDGDSDHE